MEEKLNMGFEVVFNKNTEDEERYLFRKKMRVLNCIKHNKNSECELKANYRPGVFNSGHFDTKKSALNALSQWTEKPLLEYIKQGEW